jgi:hypothetical protein
MAGLEDTFTPRVVDIDHGETVFAVDYRQTLFRRNLRRPVLTCGSSLVVRETAFERIPAFAIGWSLVAEAVHQLLEHGAEPVFAVVDYWGLAANHTSPLLEGGVGACREAGCALAPARAIDTGGSPVGAAAFAVGVAEEKRVFDASRIEAGDEVVGLLAAGFLPVDIEAGGADVGEWAQAPPARLLCRPVLQVARIYRRKQPIHAGVAPGLGLVRDRSAPLLRSLQEGVEAKLPAGLALERAPALSEPPCGVGLVLVIAPYFASSIRHQLERRGVETRVLGSIVRSAKAEAPSSPGIPPPPGPRS